MMDNEHKIGNWFGDKAKLYAENVAVVEAMYKAFQQDVHQFLDEVAHGIRSKLGHHPLCEDRRGNDARSRFRRYRYWWIGSDPKERKRRIVLWTNTQWPELITERRFRAFAEAIEAPADTIARVQNVVSLPELQPFCRAGSKKRGGRIIEVGFQLSDDDPVNDVAEKLSGVLLAMNKAEHNE